MMNNKWDFDDENDRLVAYLPSFTYNDSVKLKEDINNAVRGKRIVYTLSEHTGALKDLGFSVEAETSGFFEGEKAIILTQYDKEERKNSKTKTENEEVLNRVREDSKQISQPCLYPVGLVQDRDLKSLAALYKKVFPKYPTNIFDPEALKKAAESDYLFAAVKNGGEVIAAASAMKTGYRSAEITDCAVKPDYRGNQLLHYLVLDLEEECRKEGINHIFSITRARSTGMNMTVKRLGYQYEGTLINNCIITSGFEDMNVWSQALK
ncbi:putative beta-lysine N-acetyltransferase [Alteribacter keqinensis]|uniref:Putative beta-lysine N-acetyltransferase n=2 Tax=Alteribacter keqinensis TaxID=2483800 RepID=A0A3M7TVE2_9BACI|nr:putative beta-lysine N-acetyltransferase [Alteribacter keqinensis]